jgi:hypothetical protein
VSDQRFGIFGFLIEHRRERNFSLQDVLVNSHGIVITEWVDPCMHFINEDTKSPPIYSFPMALVQDNFGGNILWCSTDSEGSTLAQNFGESEVRQFEIAIISNEQVFRFEIPKNDVLAV